MLSKCLKMHVNPHEPYGQAGIIPKREKEEMYLALMEEKTPTAFIILNVLKEPHCCIVGEHNTHKIDFNESKKNEFTNK